jgi:hypothetical protein
MIIPAITAQKTTMNTVKKRQNMRCESGVLAQQRQERWASTCSGFEKKRNYRRSSNLY